MFLGYLLLDISSDFNHAECSATAAIFAWHFSQPFALKIALIFHAWKMSALLSSAELPVKP